MRLGSTLLRFGVIAALTLVARAVLRDRRAEPPQLAPPPRKRRPRVRHVRAAGPEATPDADVAGEEPLPARPKRS
jgi:hypothetical protein